MKTKKLFFIALILAALTSCAPTSYFQVYKASSPSDKLAIKDSLLIYEDENCKVSYNLWSEGGNIGFRFFNKTDKNIYLNLEESFFILNGLSYDYYKNRVFTYSRGATASESVNGINYLNLHQTNGIMTSSGHSVSYNEEKIICIPTMTSKIISEYVINEFPFRDCDLLKYPTKKQIKSKTFKKSDSPFVFSNRIAYSVGQTSNLIKLENEFYVSEISNYPESEMIESKYDEFCNQKSMTMTKYFKNFSPDKFYIKYTKNSMDTWKH